MQTITPLPEIDATPIRSTAYIGANERWDEIVYNYIDSIYTFSVAVNETLIPELEEWRSTIDGAFANAKTYQDNAKKYQDTAKTYQDNAASSATAAASSANNAKTYQDNAKTYQDNSKSYRDTAKTYQDNAANSASSAATSAQNSATSEANAKTYYDNLVNVTLSDYATQKWVTDKNYLTAHQSLASYVTSTTFTDTLASYALSNHNHDSSYVKLTGNQTIAGQKTVTSAIIFNDCGLQFKKPNFDSTVFPTSNVYHTYAYKDKNDKTFCDQLFYQNSEANGGGRAICWRLYTMNLSKNYSCALQVSKDNIARFAFPTPPATDNTTSGATTNWVRTHVNNSLANYVTSTTFTDTLASYALSNHNHDSSYATKANAIKALSVSGKTITYTKADDTTGTITTQDTDTHWTTTLYAGAKDAKSNAATTNGNTYLKVYDNNTVRSQLNIKGTGATTVTTDANGVITINSTDTNTTYDLSGYATQKWVTDKNYLTAHQSLANYVPISNWTTQNLGSGDQNLDDYITPGQYIFTSGCTLTNCPSGVNGLLLVFTARAATLVRQIWLRYGTNDSNEHCIYIRQKLSSGWSTWKLIVTDKSLASTLSSYVTSTTFTDTLASYALSNHTHSNYLPLTGGTLTGDLTIKKSRPKAFFQDPRATKGTAPSDNLYNIFCSIQDNAGITYGGIEHVFKTTRENRINMIVYPGTTDNTSTNAQISVGFDTDGNCFTYAPTPASTDNSTKIATTAWVIAKIKELAVLKS